jgi:hypothetical protein
MTEVLSPNDDGIRDFTSHVNVKFRIDDDVFTGVVGIPANDLMHFGSLFDGVSDSDLADKPDAFKQMFELILDHASAMVFIARMSDKTKPITLTQIMDVLPWLMEQYGMRPSQPSSESSSGSANPDDGTSLTGSASATASTSSDFPPTAS